MELLLEAIFAVLAQLALVKLLDWWRARTATPEGLALAA